METDAARMFEKLALLNYGKHGMLLCSLRLINAKIHSIVQESFIFQFPVAIIKINSQSVVERERKKIDRQTKTD